ncbi:MAG: type II secretion system secretin GspD [Thermodesulfobacteriota bacterium]
MRSKNFWIKLFILLLVIGFSGCSGMNLSLKPKLAQEDSQKQKKTERPMAEAPAQPPKAPDSIPLPVPPKVVPPVGSQPLAPSATPPVRPSSAPTPSPPTKPAEPRTGPGVVFNFDNADIYEVIRVMAEIMKINYIIDPRVKGVVNIRTAGQITTEEVFPIFQSILRLNGATAVKKDNLYEIVPFGDAKKLFISPTDRIEPGKLIPEGRYMIQIVPLKYIPVTEVSKILKPFLTDGADIVEHPPHNILIIGDVASNIRKALDIITLFDLDIFTDLRVRIYPILNADVTEIAKEMERIFSSFEVSVKSGRGVGITFTPISRINSLLVVSSIPNIFDKVEGWLKELDKTPAEGTKLGVYVYYVQNSKAKDLAEVLKQIFMGVKEKKADFKEEVTEPTPRGVKPPSAPTPTPTKEEAPSVPEGEINIVVDETNNSLVIKAYARDYKNILETVKKLDIYPRQVLIEVLLAEITLDDETRYGVEFLKLLDTASHGRFQQTIDIGPTTVSGIGIKYSIVETAGRFSAAIKAAAKDERLNVISSPHILASNNKEAKIQIGVAQPVLTTTYTTTATATTNVVEGTIEYKDVGIIITVTPRISDGGLVTMEITIEDSKVDTTALGGLQNIPVFKKKTAKTVLSVLEGQTIVIGGLLEDSKNVKKSGIPLLSKIPLLGSLFGTQEYEKDKKELILLMTPHIITDHLQSRAVTEEFKEKLEGIKKELKKWEEKKGKEEEKK